MIAFITYFGNLLAETLVISPPAARGLLKLSIMDEFGPFKPLNQVSLNEMKEVLEGALKNRLLNLSIKHCDEIINLMLSKLRENQSLITMGGF